MPLDFVLVAGVLAVLLFELGIRRWIDTRAARRRLRDLNTKHL